MIIELIQKDDDYYEIKDLVNDLKKNPKVDDSGAIFTFEGFVRGNEENKIVEKLIQTTPDKEKAKKEMEEIAESAKIKYGVYQINLVHFVGEFYTGDPLFLVAVLGPHRTETLDALKEVIERVKFDIDFKKEEISNEGTKIILAGG
ncbi:MAG: molybdenum cofactor biosynthesis protein MoaE [Methanobacteriaceae archaeon]|nr:molybdenum cofactor biosynthesis protein MoaE [Methanobacteriaceae archaeon]